MTTQLRFLVGEQSSVLAKMKLLNAVPDGTLRRTSVSW